MPLATPTSTAMSSTGRRDTRARRSAASRRRRCGRAARARVGAALAPRSTLMRRTVAGEGARGSKSPRDLPARRAPKLPATVSPSGSGAPSDLRAVAASDRTAGGGSPAALRPPAARRLDLAALRGRAPPATRGRSAEGRPASALRRLPGREAPLPALRPSSAPRSSASGLAAFVGSPGSVAALRRLRRLVRSPRVGASTAWSEANCTGGTARGQPGVPAGQSMNAQVRGRAKKE